jgi:chromosome segregation ATPase
MSFLDKVTKAVGEAVDRGKKDIDQFLKIQKINSEIGGIEKKIAEFKSQIHQVQQQAGEKAIVLCRAGTLASADLQAFADQVSGFEQEIAAEEEAIAAKKAEIEEIKTEHDATSAAPPPADSPAVIPPPLPGPAGRFCSQCGAPLTGGAFCPQCGTKWC